MLAVIRQRQRGRLVGGLDYTVYDSGGHRLFGTLPHMATSPGWSEMTGPPDGDEPEGELEQLVVYSVPLNKGYWLMVGDDIGKRRQGRPPDHDHLRLGAGADDPFAAAGGIALSMGFLGRVDAITRTAEAIIGGNIHRRIPLRGTADDLDRLAGTLNRMLDRIGALMESAEARFPAISPMICARRSAACARRWMKPVATPTPRPTMKPPSIVRWPRRMPSWIRSRRCCASPRSNRAAAAPAFRELDLSALVASIGQTFAPVAEDEGRALSLDVAPGLEIEGDRELLVQMLANLIENAIHHAGAGAQIAIALAASPAGPVLTVSDNGPGIPAAEREAVLQRFYRLERSRTHAGNGLGLSLVAAIVELHHAEIALQDNGPGLKVVIRFAAREQAVVGADDGEQAVRGVQAAIGPVLGPG